MKKLIFKTALFVAPFLILFYFSIPFTTIEKSDLSRLGYLLNKDYNYRILFKNEIAKPKRYVNISESNLKKRNNFDFLTIGDSFSEQGNLGYQNYLAKLSGKKVLHFDRFLHKNPLETIHGLLNGDVLNKINVKYIILQSVERSFVNRSKAVRKKHKITIDWIQKSIQKPKNDIFTSSKPQDFFTKAIFKFPLYNLYYNFDDNAFFSPVYKVKTKVNLFSTNKNELLFFNEDLDNLKETNTKESVIRLNNELNTIANRLKTKGITLIVLPCPDKFDFYYDNILEKEKYTRPLFFNFLQDLPKDYLYVNSKKCLTEKSKNRKDIYFYDDTHWTPNACEIIATEINDLVQKR